MPELGTLLEQEMRVIRPAEFELVDVRRKRERRQRNRRLGNIVLAFVIAALATLWLARAFVHVKHQVPAVRPPTGTILFSRQVAGSEFDYLFTIDSEASGETRLLPKGADMFSISPDGSRVLYPDIDETRPNWVLPAVVNIDGSGRRLVRASVPTHGFWPDGWSPDGGRFVGIGQQASSPRDGLYTARSSDGGDLIQITAPPGRRTDFGIGYSPDGSRVMFLRSAKDTPARSPGSVKDLFVVNVDGAGLVQLNPPGTVLGPFDSGVAGTPARPVNDHRAASWSPDGTRVAFAAALATPSEARQGVVRRGLFVVAADGRGALPIATGQILDAQWSPDGRWIAFSQANPDRPDIFIVHPDGTDRRPLTSSKHGLGSWGPVWSPDGSRLLFVRNAGGGQFDSELWFVKTDGSDLTQLTHAPAEYFSYGWSPRLPRST